MGYDRLDLAEALLAKARSTAFEPERATFVAGAHDQLAAFLRSQPAGGGHRSAAKDHHPTGQGHHPAGSGHRPAGKGHQAPALQAAVPARRAAVGALPSAAGGQEGAPILDLTAVEDAYQARYRPPAGAGALVDLAI